MPEAAPINVAPYASVPEFIYGITRDIWEDRGIGNKLDAYYAKNIALRAPTGFTGSNAGVAAQTLHPFPDRQLVGEDVVWRDCGDGSFLSSHRLASVITHTGSGSYGRAKGALVRSCIIEECWVKPSLCPASFSKDSAAQTYCSGLQKIWQEKDTSAVRGLYFHGASFYAPGGQTRYGHADIDRFVMGYLASFPDAVLRIHSTIVNREPESAVRLAIRWSLDGTHTGYGHFCEPTGAPIHIMALSHVHMTQGRVVSDWLLTDEVAIWKQIFAHQSSRQPSA